MKHVIKAKGAYKLFFRGFTFSGPNSVLVAAENPAEAMRIARLAYPKREIESVFGQNGADLIEVLVEVETADATTSERC
jgi:hypothetical protein